MLKCYLTNIKEKRDVYLSDTPVEVNDDNEYMIAIEIKNHDASNEPIVMIGDIQIQTTLQHNNQEDTALYYSKVGSFYDNAFFLNYFGQCELSVKVGDFYKKFIVAVNVTGYKANIAKEMLSFLSNNAEDILQSCYSKSQTGFSFKQGAQRDVIKLNALAETVKSLENLFNSFKKNTKYYLRNELEYNSNKQIVVDDTSAYWLSENMDELELSNSNSYKLKIKQKYYQANIPNSVTVRDTDLKENRALHQFVLVALKYLTEMRVKMEQQTQNITEHTEYNEYVKFDNVIKGIITPIILMRIKTIDSLMARIKRIHLFFKTTIPVSKVSGEMPVQTSYTLRHKHYALAFNQIARFYNTSDADKSNSEFLLGLRNLSQLFELCCLYYLVRYFKKISTQTSASWLSKNLQWTGKSTDKINVLANNFIFDSNHHKYTLNYEKKFYSLSKDTIDLQKDNLIRVDQSDHYYEPDFTIKVLNKLTGEYYFIILDAKFSRSYKMKNKKADQAPSVLQTIFTKYSTNLKTYKDGRLVDLTRYVGVLFGLSKSDKEQNRINMFNKLHDIDGLAPIYPFAAADFISFSDDFDGIDKILDKYISK